MPNFKEDHPEFEADYFDPESFFSLEYYREYYEKTEKEAILYFTQNEHRYKELQKGFPKLSVATLKTMAWKSYSPDIHYEEKLAIWNESGASPFDAEYRFKFKIKSKEKPLTIVASILPKNELQKNLYLQFLIEYISGEYIKNNELYGAKILSYYDLKEQFLKDKKDVKIEKESITQKCNQIAKDCSLTVNFSDYLHYLKYHNNLSSLNIEQLERIENLWALAIELAFYQHYAKYYLFLENYDNSSTKDKKLYKSEENKTFKTAEYFDDLKLLKLHKLLVDENCISEINYNDFKKVFTQTEIRYGIYRHQKINWKLERNHGMNKQALLTLIEYVVSPDYTDENKAIISKIIGTCFTFENKDISENISKSFNEAFNSFKNKKYKNSKKIEEIMNKIL
ncbi:hypothetical protein CQ046_20200 [Chryseobacterium sp. MYb7]|uniref:hypothetical protein n=1 Tax=Chryseobacterium sp. MYb7 TaxID=1827290 RepID=UPI000D00FCCA|nr:hypothetical protein [Chryseobacterium sp. MYb7]PRA97800.1 hypothetical protein CQ046_20200 [Chryseobacterium sp. MYb7]